MFSSISWSEFFNTVVIAVGAYYVVSTLLFYSKDLIERFKNRSATPEEQEHKPSSHGSLMGEIKKDPPKKHQQEVSAQELVIEPSENSNGIHENSEDNLLIGSVSDLLHEAKVLARVVKESNGSKEDGSPMFQSLLSNYPHLVGTKYQDSISVYIHDQVKIECSFEVDLQEIRSWWPIADTQINNQ
jgi:hypothetical protein